MPTTTSPTGPATICGTRSTPRSCAPSWAGPRRSRTSAPGSADTIAWYRENQDWWRPQKAATETKYAKTGAVNRGVNAPAHSALRTQPCVDSQDVTSRDCRASTLPTLGSAAWASLLPTSGILQLT